MTAALIIDDMTHALIFADKRRAEHNPISYERMGSEDASNVQPVPVPMSYLVRYAVEEREPGQFYRHLVVSHSECQPTDTPHTSVVEEMMREYRFHSHLDDVEGWLTGESQGNAVHVMEPLHEGEWAPPPAALPLRDVTI